MSDGYTVDKSEIEDRLRLLAEAYPIEIFCDPDPPLVDEPKNVQLQAQRNASALMRHHSRFFVQAADQIATLQAELYAEREANKRLREAAEAVLWASNVERIYAAEGEELVAMVKERREAFAALSVALEGKQNAHD